MDEHLGIRFAFEGVTLRNEGILQDGIVLNDTVMYQCQTTGPTGMGVGIYVVGFPVGSPAGMANAYVAGSIVFGNFFAERGNLPFLFPDGKGIVQYGDTGTVVTTVFQPFQAFDDQSVSLAMADVSNYSAHSISELGDKGSSDVGEFRTLWKGY